LDQLKFQKSIIISSLTSVAYPEFNLDEEVENFFGRCAPFSKITMKSLGKNIVDKGKFFHFSISEGGGRSPSFTLLTYLNSSKCHQHN
jgi:hypothetical protein